MILLFAVASTVFGLYIVVMTIIKPLANSSKHLNEIVSDIKPDGTTEITIVPNTDEGKQTIINITEDTKVNKIKVTTDNGKGEAQIVVKDGVTLDVGNGGVVSENDILTTVLVESGGTLIIGTGGVDQEGNATPIEIKASEEKGTGTLIFSPSAKQEDTKKYAEVNLYTYCKKVNGKYTWQQFAIPVTGLTNDKVVKAPNQTSYVFKWDYATYGWSQLNNWAQLDEPFAGYDVTNVSEDGGVVYTFKGDLIGNQNIQLTLPHSDYCVMGNSYTAPISIDALFEQISKEMNQSGEGTIEKRIPAMMRMFGKYGIDIRKEPILVYPTLHYQNGGIDISDNGESGVKNLFVAGEAVGGIHGRNRLMGNSLLDVIVFGRNAGKYASARVKDVKQGKLTLDHVKAFESELEKAGIKSDKLSPQILPDYRRKDM